MVFVGEFAGNVARLLDRFSYDNGPFVDYVISEKRNPIKIKLPKRNDGYSAGDVSYQDKPDFYSTDLEFIPEVFRNSYRTVLRERGIDNIMFSDYPLEVLGDGKAVVGKRDKNKIYLWKADVRPSLFRAWLAHEIFEGEEYITDKPHYKVGQEAQDWLASIGDTDAYLDTLEINMKDLDYVRPAKEAVNV